MCRAARPLTASAATVTVVVAAYSKPRRENTLRLRPILAALLAPHLATKAPAGVCNA